MTDIDEYPKMLFAIANCAHWFFVRRLLTKGGGAEINEEKCQEWTKCRISHPHVHDTCPCCSQAPLYRRTWGAGMKNDLEYRIHHDDECLSRRS